MNRSKLIESNNLIISALLIMLFLLIGVLVNNVLTDRYIQRNDEYNKALKIDSDKDLFKQAMAANFGKTFVYGELEANEPVSYEEIEGEYLYVQKVTERYTRHTRIVIKTRPGSNGKIETYQTTEVYWTWDRIEISEKKSDTIVFLDVNFPYSKFDFPNAEYIETKYNGSNLRNVYYGLTKRMSGTIYTDFQDNTISEKNRFTQKTLCETVNGYLVNIEKINIIFWLIWIALIVLSIFGINIWKIKHKGG